MDVTRSRSFPNEQGRSVWEYRSVYTMRDCPECGAQHLLPDDPQAVCFRCGNESNPYKSIRMAIEVGSEDSTDPARIADGTSQYNVGLPGVETVVGTRADGRPRTEYRPVTNAELGTGRARRRYAEQHGLKPVEKKTLRAVGR